jgi:hypothetical protein
VNEVKIKTIVEENFVEEICRPPSGLEKCKLDAEMCASEVLSK